VTTEHTFHSEMICEKEGLIKEIGGEPASRSLRSLKEKLKEGGKKNDQTLAAKVGNYIGIQKKKKRSESSEKRTEQGESKVRGEG